MKFSLSAHPPFNFLSIVNSHGWRQLAPFSYDETTNTLGYILRLSKGRVIELKMRDGMDGVIVETEKLDKTERKEVAEKVTWMFGLDMDFAHFYRASIMKRGHGRSMSGRSSRDRRAARSPCPSMV